MCFRRVWLTVVATAATLALLLPTNAVLPAAALPAATASTPPTGSESPTASQVPFTSIPPVTTIELATGIWEPSALERIVVVQDGLTPSSTANDVAPGALREADRLAHEFAAAGLVASAPTIAYTSPEVVEQQPNASQLVLALDEGHRERRDEDDLNDNATITVDERGVTITAADPTGLFRAGRALLQTLNANGKVSHGSYELGQSSPTRSVHLDVARKRYAIDTIEQLLRQMSWLGLNELELHFSENEGWAIASDAHSEIVSDDAYTKAEIRELIAYAADLHIRITPSLDMPGHFDHVLETHPEWQLRANDGSPVFGALNISDPQAREFAFELIDEYAELFEPGPWNLGADEFVDFADYSEVAVLSEYARANIGADANASDALTEFVNEADARLQQHGYSVRVWSDGMLKGSSAALNPEIAVAYWTTRPADVAGIDEFAVNGNPLLNVNDEYLYFVLGERVGYRYPTGEEILSDWDAGVFPGGQLAGGDAEVTGGMFAVWSDIPEALDDAELLARLRLPLAAMAWKLTISDELPGWDEFQQLVKNTGEPIAVPLSADGSRAQGEWPVESSPSPTTNEPDAPGNGPGLLPWLLAVGAALVVAAFATLRRRRASG